MLALAVGSACKSKPTAPPPLPPSTLAAAIQLGFAAGSFVAQGAQPLDLRKVSSFAFARTEADLHTFMGRLQISESDAAGIVAGLLDGFADPNPTRGGQLISDAIGQIGTRLESSPYPELLYAFRVGYTVGHMAEAINVVTKGTPEPLHAPALATLTAKNRESLQTDLDQSGLQGELYDAILATNVELRGVSDIFTLNRACLKVQSLVAQLQ
jgi:hypothetical protein